MTLYRFKHSRRIIAVLAAMFLMLLFLFFLFPLFVPYPVSQDSILILIIAAAVCLFTAAFILLFDFARVRINEEGVTVFGLFRDRSIPWEKCSETGIRTVYLRYGNINYFYFSRKLVPRKRGANSKSNDFMINIEYREEILEAVRKYAPPNLIADLAEKLKASGPVKMKKSR